MSYEYLVMTNKELIKVFGEPIDVTTAPTTELLAEGWTLDENGKDMAHNRYGLSPDLSNRRSYDKENNPFWNKKHTMETRRRMSEKKMGRPGHKKTEEECQAISKRQMGGNNTSSRAVSIDGIKYETMLEASQKLGVHKDTVWWRVRKGGPKWQDWKLDL